MVKRYFGLMSLLLLLVACGAGTAVELPTVESEPPTVTEERIVLEPTAESENQLVTEGDPTPIAPEKSEPVADSGEASTHRNRLADEKSPYLLQHADNPVDWYPWGEEAFAKARAENKPIFLSIGYSTCHWCHVMEDESFEDAEVAALMNEAFINIKVDREERPDIDQIYMNVSMMMTGSGGWPLNVIMTPDQKPFFAGTYIPKENRFERVGMLDLVPRIHAAWVDDSANVLDVAQRVTDALQESNAVVAGEELGSDTLQATFEQLGVRFDQVNGGFGTQPKFPTPHNLLFLLRHWQRSRDAQALQMVETTLDQMRLGGIYDQVGYGFHRYSTDAEWGVPHFEKMLYDQAMLTMAYTEGFLATGNAEYETTAREVLTYVMRDMRDVDGGFYSAENADSEGVEGKFYVWTKAELEAALSADEVDFVQTRMNASDEGNFEEGGWRANILSLAQGLEGDDLAQWELIRPKLFTEREQRIHPSLDDKVLTDWNGLMIAAFAKAGQAFNEPLYVQAAADSADFMLNTMFDADGRLLHRYRDGDAGIAATLDDHAFLIWGLLELYEATFELRYLQQAIALQDAMIEHFWDTEAGGFYLTADDAEVLLARPKEIYDGAIPSGNSVGMVDLLRIGRITGNTEYEELAAQIGRAFGANVARAPMGHTQLMAGVDFGVGPSFEIVIVGERDAADTQALLDALRQEYVPNKVVLLRGSAENDPLIEIASFTEFQYALEDKATAYVCLNYFCKQPTNDAEQMLKLIRDQ